MNTTRMESAMVSDTADTLSSPAATNFGEAKWNVRDAQNILGTFAYNIFEREGLLPFAFKVLSGVEFTPAEALYLANTVSLPILAKLVSILRMKQRSESEIFLRPVCFLPIAALIEEKGRQGALASCRAYLEQISADLLVQQPLCLAIDRWQGKFDFEELLHVLGEVSHLSFIKLTFRALGPSSAEVMQLLEGKENVAEGLLSLLEVLRAHGIVSIDGGSDIEVHRVAAEHGFLVSVGQLISVPKKSQPNKSLGDKLELDASPQWFDEGFIRGLNASREVSENRNQFRVWFPWSLGSLDRMENLEGQPLGLQLLRAVALGRLLLPKLPFIRAPLSLLGVKLAHVALDYGANDLGFAAVDSRTADYLGLTPLSGIVEIMEKRNAFLRVLA